MLLSAVALKFILAGYVSNQLHWRGDEVCIVTTGRKAERLALVQPGEEEVPRTP